MRRFPGSAHKTEEPEQIERRSQVRGLLWLALAALAFAIARAAMHGGMRSVFARGWWRW